jgi:hypothetical protein
MVKSFRVITIKGNSVSSTQHYCNLNLQYPGKSAMALHLVRYNQSWAPVAHACDPSYSGGRYQEDHGLKPTQQIVHETLSQKLLKQKELVEWLKV